MWKWEAVLRTCFVQVCEVDTNSSLTILLFYNDDISEPIWVIDFSYGASFYEFLHLFINNAVSFRSKPSSLLFDRNAVGIDIQFVRHYFWVNADHVCVGPSKTVMVFHEKLDKALPKRL